MLSARRGAVTPAIVVGCTANHVRCVAGPGQGDASSSPVALYGGKNGSFRIRSYFDNSGTSYAGATAVGVENKAASISGVVTALHIIPHIAQLWCGLGNGTLRTFQINSPATAIETPVGTGGSCSTAAFSCRGVSKRESVPVAQEPAPSTRWSEDATFTLCAESRQHVGAIVWIATLSPAPQVQGSLGVSAPCDTCLVACASHDGTVTRWRTTHPFSCIGLIAKHSGAIRCATLAEQYLITGGDDRPLRVWPAHPLEPNILQHFVFQGHSGAVCCVVCTETAPVYNEAPSGSCGRTSALGSCVPRRLLWSGGADKVVRVWDFSASRIRGAPTAAVDVGGGAPRRGRSGGGGERLSAPRECSVSTAYESDTGSSVYDEEDYSIKMLLGHKSSVVSLTHVGQMVLSCDQEGTVLAWHVEKHWLLHSFVIQLAGPSRASNVVPHAPLPVSSHLPESAAMAAESEQPQHNSTISVASCHGDASNGGRALAGVDGAPYGQTEITAGELPCITHTVHLAQFQGLVWAVGTRSGVMTVLLPVVPHLQPHVPTEDAKQRQSSSTTAARKEYVSRNSRLLTTDTESARSGTSEYRPNVSSCSPRTARTLVEREVTAASRDSSVAGLSAASLECGTTPLADTIEVREWKALNDSYWTSVLASASAQFQTSLREALAEMNVAQLHALHEAGRHAEEQRQRLADERVRLIADKAIVEAERKRLMSARLSFVETTEKNLREHTAQVKDAEQKLREDRARLQQQEEQLARMRREELKRAESDERARKAEAARLEAASHALECLRYEVEAAKQTNDAAHRQRANELARREASLAEERAGLLREMSQWRWEEHYSLEQREQERVALSYLRLKHGDWDNVCGDTHRAPGETPSAVATSEAPATIAGLSNTSSLGSLAAQLREVKEAQQKLRCERDAFVLELDRTRGQLADEEKRLRDAWQELKTEREESQALRDAVQQQRGQLERDAARLREQWGLLKRDDRAAVLECSLLRHQAEQLERRVQEYEKELSEYKQKTALDKRCLIELSGAVAGAGWGAAPAHQAESLHAAGSNSARGEESSGEAPPSKPLDLLESQERPSRSSTRPPPSSETPVGMSKLEELLYSSTPLTSRSTVSSNKGEHPMDLRSAWRRY